MNNKTKLKNFHPTETLNNKIPRHRAEKKAVRQNNEKAEHDKRMSGVLYYLNRLDIYGGYLEDVNRPTFKLYSVFICPVGAIWLYQDGATLAFMHVFYITNLLFSGIVYGWKAVPSFS